MAHASPYVKGEPLLARRLDKNAAAVDVLNSNRDIWFAAGGPDIEPLANPTEPMIDHCKRTVTVLQAMLEKHSAQGGLDSHVEDITNPVHSWAEFTHSCSIVYAVIRVSPVSLR